MASAIDTQLMLSFAVTAMLTAVIPSPSVLFIVNRALAVGRPAAIAAAAGNTMGATCQGLLAAFGLGAVFAGAPTVYDVVRFSGAAYLVIAGAKTLRGRAAAAVGGDARRRAGGRRNEAFRGFTVGVTSPKTVVFFAAALPQFVDPARGQVVVQVLLLLLVYGTISLFRNVSWGMAAGSMRSWAAVAPRRLERLIGAGGIGIIVTGVALTVPGVF